MSMIDEVEVGDIFYVPLYQGGREMRYVRKLTVASTPATMVRLVADNSEHIQYRAMRNKQHRAPDGCLMARQAGLDGDEVTLYPEGHSKVADFRFEAERVRRRNRAYVLAREAQRHLGSTGDLATARTNLLAALDEIKGYLPDEEDQS